MGKNHNVTRGSGILEGFLAKKRANLANSLIPEKVRGGRILDIGCGTYPYFLESTEFSEKYGVDQVPINNKVDNVSLRKLNFEDTKLPYQSEYFDVVTMLAVFEHINKHKLNFVISEIRRVQKKGGLFIITTPSPWSDKLLHFMARFGLISKEEIHDHKHSLFPDNVKKILAEAKFDEKNIKNGFFEVSFNMWFTAQK